MFHVDRTKKDGYTYQCKECRLEKQKEWMQKPETKKMRAVQAREFRATKEGGKYSRAIAKKCQNKTRFGGNRQKVLDAFNNECYHCKTGKRLCVHHIDCNGRNSKKPNNEIDNLMVLCTSCHMKLHRKLQAIDKLGGMFNG